MEEQRARVECPKCHKRLVVPWNAKLLKHGCGIEFSVKNGEIYIKGKRVPQPNTPKSSNIETPAHPGAGAIKPSTMESTNMPPPLPSNKEEWFYAFGDQRVGPVSISILSSLVSRGDISDVTLVWNKGFSEWQEARNVAELRDLFSQVNPPPLRGSSTKQENGQYRNTMDGVASVLGSGMKSGVAISNKITNNVSPFIKKPEGCPEQYLVLSFIYAILCCPIGLWPLCYSMKVRRAYLQGDIEAARTASNKARRLFWIIPLLLIAMVIMKIIAVFFLAIFKTMN